jgi:hypothetical protein
VAQVVGVLDDPVGLPVTLCVCVCVSLCAFWENSLEAINAPDEVNAAKALGSQAHVRGSHCGQFK